jgi:HD-GYP domain-containing protein (c-di-GMP phosphodiesterase class II)/ribonuclease BN (tRNA processing enzyme)
MSTIKILGAYGNRGQNAQTTCIQVSKHSVIDAGNIIQGLGTDAKYIDNIFLTHSHLDHIVDSAFLCDSFFQDRIGPIKIYGLKETLDIIKTNIFNWDIWPDFSKVNLSVSSKKSLEFVELQLNQEILVDDVGLTPISSNHTVACCGYKIKNDDTSMIFTSDTYKNDDTWNLINSDKSIKSLIIDVSFPSSLKDMAKVSRHLTPKILYGELGKLTRDDVEIFVSHLKPNYKTKIIKELKKIGIKEENILLGGEIIDIKKAKIIAKKELDYIEKINLLNKIGTSLSLNDDLNSILEEIIKEAKKMANADGGTLYLLNDKTKELDFEVIHTSSLDIKLGGKNEKIDWPSLPLFLKDGSENRKMVAATCALEDRVINIEDVYEAKNYDFSGTKIFDKNNNYKSKSMLVVPLKNHEKKIIGVLQIINKVGISGNIIAFNQEDEDIILSLASQAAVALTNANLIQSLEDLLEAFLNSIIYALRKKSPYTANHIHKMVSLSKMLAIAVDKDDTVFKNVRYSKNDIKKINLSALMHDVGKLSTPDYILDKATKLDGLFDRIEIIKTRTWAIKKELEVDFLKKNISFDEFDAKVKSIDKNLDILVKNNTGTEFLPQEIVDKIYDISKKAIICDNQKFYLITKEEAMYLSIQKGTLSEEERKIINDHATVSLEVLNRLHFPEKYKEIPHISGAHHEKINGTGYPLGLKGDEISLEARILAIADIFEAITASDRPYKKANSLSSSMKILYYMAKDGELDKKLVKFFYESGLYKKYADKALNKEQIDEVNLDFSLL